MEPTRRLTNKQKGKVMMLKYDTCKDKLNRDESNYEKNEDGFCLALWIELETFNLQHWHSTTTMAPQDSWTLIIINVVR